MKVHISAAGREVTVDCADTNVTVRDVLVDVLAAWKATDPGRPETNGAAVGFVTDRRGTAAVAALHPAGRGYSREVDV